MTVDQPATDTGPEVVPDPVSMDDWAPTGMYTADQAAHVLGVSPDDIRAMAERGEIHSYTWPRGTWYAPSEIQVLKEASENGAKSGGTATTQPPPGAGTGQP